MSDLAKYLQDLNFEQREKPSLSEVKKRWKELCLKYHPDISGERKDFDRVTHAYMMITDPSYRNKFLVENLKKRPNSKGDLNIRMQAPITFEDAFFGRRVVISYNYLELDDQFQPVIQEEPFEIITEYVDYPAGRMQGYEHVFSGKGHKCGDERGDCLVVFTPLAHKKFQVQGSRVIANEQIPLAMMLTGGKIDVQTMWGTRTLIIPPGTPPASKLKIRGCGVNQIGDHICVAAPIYPTKKQLKEKDWQGLDIKWEMEEEAAKDKEAERYINIFTDSGTGGIRFE